MGVSKFLLICQVFTGLQLQSTLKMDFKRNVFMFRNLIMPCAARSRDEIKLNVLLFICCGIFPRPAPRGSVSAQKSWRSFQSKIKYHLLQEGLLIPPAGCISASPEFSAACLDLSCGTWHFLPCDGFACIGASPSLPTCELSRTRPVTVPSPCRAWKRMLWLLSVPEGFSAIP